MRSAFTYIEYSFNTTQITQAEVDQKLLALGFVCSARHLTKNLCLWNQNKVIIMIKQDDTKPCGITGTAYTVNTADIENHDFDFKFDSSTTTYTAQDPNGFNIIALPFEVNVFDYNFSVADTADAYHAGSYIENISGLIYKTTSTVDSFYQGLDFRSSSKCTDSIIDFYDKINIRFLSGAPSIPTLICDTKNIFSTTAKLASAGVIFQDFTTTGDSIGALDWKVGAYNCFAVGNSKSYTIENRVPDALPGMDLVMRTRNKFMHISSESIELYYG